MGLSWVEVDEIKGLYQRLPPNSMIFSQDELEACQKHPNYDNFTMNCLVLPLVPYQQVVRLQYLYRPE